MDASLITIALGETEFELELSELEQHALRRLCSLLGYDPRFSARDDETDGRVYSVHTEAWDTIAEGCSVSLLLIDALYRLASEDGEALHELRTTVDAFQRAARNLLEA